MHSAIDNLNRKVLFPVMELLFVGYITCIRNIIGYNTYVKLMTAVMLLSFVLYFLGGFSAYWLKTKSIRTVMLIIAAAYLACRLISFVQNGCDRSIRLSIVLEMYYVIVVIGTPIGGFRRRSHAYFLFVASSLCQAANLVVYFNYEKFPQVVKSWFLNNTPIKDHPYSALSTNPNAAGILCALTAVVALIYFLEEKNIRARVIALITGIFQIVCLAILYNGVRSAIFSMAVSVVLLIVGIVFKKKRGRNVVLGVFTFAMVFLVGLGCFFSQKTYNQMEPLNENEIRLNAISSDRYIIWKTCYITFDKSTVFGRGSLKLEKRYRKQYAAEHENEVTTVHITAARFSPHNGYIELLTVSGWLGFALIMSFVCLAIADAEHLNKGYWYIIVCFILINNLFEGLFILDRFFPCLYLFRELSVTFFDDSAAESMT